MKRNQRKLKIRWKNIALLIILIMCIYIVCHDVYMITIHSWITGYMYGWTWYGFITFLLAFIVGVEIIEYIIEEFRK